MILREISFDLLWVENEECIKQLQVTENLDYIHACRKYYEVNCKAQRVEFNLLTRCMTSMIIGVMEKTTTPSFGKIVFECTENVSKDICCDAVRVLKKTNSI